MKFKKNGRTHAALLIARSLKRWFTVKELREISAAFGNIKLTSQSLNLLKRQGLLQKDGEHWAITTAGIRFLYETAPTNKIVDAEN